MRAAFRFETLRSWAVLTGFMMGTAAGCTGSMSSEDGGGSGDAGSGPTGGDASAPTDAGERRRDPRADASDGDAMRADPAPTEDAGRDGGSAPAEWPPYPTNPFVITLEQSIEAGEGGGGFFAHELDGDGLYDYVVTTPDGIAAYAHDGSLLWTEPDPIRVDDTANFGNGYPGRHHPGAIAGDTDGDGAAEVAYLTTGGALLIRSGSSGAEEARFTGAPVEGADALAIANLRGDGDRDAVLQFGQDRLVAIRLDDASVLWESDEWISIEHSPVRTTDIDGDGRDEVVGPVLLDDDGMRMHGWDLERDRGTELERIDSVAIGDVEPGGDLEAVLAEQGGNNETLVLNATGLVWGELHDPPNFGECASNPDPDKVAVGDFDPTRPGEEVFARSSCGRFPWVFDPGGHVIATWSVEETAPEGWHLGELTGTEGGIEEISPIDWEGGNRRLLLLKERHVDRDAALVDALTGEFVRVFSANATRVYAADVAGDYREEVLVLEPGDPGRLRIFWNDAPNDRARPRHWQDQAYRRRKQNWNYYSP